MSKSKDFLDLVIKEGMIHVTPTGEIYRRGKLVKESGFNCGYKEIIVYRKGVVKTYKSHQVIWTFLKGRIPDDLVIDHINNDRSDNRLENLRLISRKENSAKKVYKNGKPMVKDIFNEIEAMRLEGKTQKECAGKFGLSGTAVGRHYLKNGIKWKPSR